MVGCFWPQFSLPISFGHVTLQFFSLKEDIFMSLDSEIDYEINEMLVDMSHVEA